MLGLEEPLTRRQGLHLELLLALLLGLEDRSFVAHSFLDGVDLLHKLINAFTLGLLAVRSRQQTGGLLVLIPVEQVHLADVEELQSVHAVVDMRLADYGLELVLLLGVALAVSLILLRICVGLEVTNEVFSSDQPEILEGGVEDNLVPVGSLILQLLDLPPDQLILQQFLHLLLAGELVGRDEDALLEEAIVLVQAGRYVLRVFLERGDGEWLRVALVGDHLRELYEIFRVLGSVEGQFPELDVGELLAGLVFGRGEVVARGTRWLLHAVFITIIIKQRLQGSH